MLRKSLLVLAALSTAAPSGNLCPWCPVMPDDVIELDTTVDIGTLIDPAIEVKRDQHSTPYPLDSGMSGMSNTVQLPEGALDETTNGVVTEVHLSYYQQGTGGPVYTSEALDLTWEL